MGTSINENVNKPSNTNTTGTTNTNANKSSNINSNTSNHDTSNSASNSDSNKFNNNLNDLKVNAFQNRQISNWKIKLNNLSIKYWDNPGKFFGTDGNFLVFSKMFKIGIFPFAILFFCIVSIGNPKYLPWSSWDSSPKRETLASLNDQNVPSKYDEILLQSQKDSMFLELRQREVNELEVWVREHPGEKVTPKIRRRIRNGIIKDMMEKYHLNDLPEPENQVEKNSQI